MEFIKYLIADITEEITNEEEDKVTNELLIKPKNNLCNKVIFVLW